MPNDGKRKQTAAVPAVDYSDGAAVRHTLITAALSAASGVNAPMPDMAPIEKTADGTVEVSAEAQAVINLTALLAATPDSSPTHAVLVAALASATAVQEAQAAAAAQEAAHTQESSDALAAAAAYNLSDDVLDSMLKAIDAKYAPAPAVEAAQEAAPIAPVRGTKPVGVVASARNADVEAALAVDTELAARADATIAAYFAADHDRLVGVHALANTRFASIVSTASAGAGVANHADYVILATAVRLRLPIVRNMPVGAGKTVADIPWITSTANSMDVLRHKFSDMRALALYPDGRFRLALPNTPDVRFCHADASALNAFKGSARAASAAPVAPTAPTSKPIVPTAPDAQADVLTGAVTRTARCRHCPTKNVVGAAVCRACGAADWHAE